MTNLKYRKIIPFTALVGQEKMKKALILNVINPKLGGLLIRGDKGTGKSTAVRSLAHVLPEINVISDCPFSCDPGEQEDMCSTCRERKVSGESMPRHGRKIRVVDLPLGITEDRLLGTLDIERALREGIKALEPGVLANVNRGILYIDEVNLLDDSIADILLDSAAMGINTIEREGISIFHPSKFVLIASMNPEEGELRPQLLDRFGLYVRIRAITDIEERFNILKLISKFDEKPDEVEKYYEHRQNVLLNRMVKARRILSQVEASERVLKFCAYLVTLLGIKTHRAEINLMRAAKAKAAYDDRLSVTFDDIKDVADLVLTHRTEVKPFEEPYLDESLLSKKIFEAEQIIDAEGGTKEKRMVQHRRGDAGLEDVVAIPVVDEGEIFGVGKFYSESPLDVRSIKKKWIGK